MTISIPGTQNDGLLYFLYNIIYHFLYGIYLLCTITSGSLQ